VVNVNTTVIHNTYVDRTNVNVNVGVHTSFNGGAGGIQARPSAQEAAYEHENHVPPTTQQQQHVQMAHSDKANFASANGGHPAHLTAVTVNNYRSTTINNVNNSHNNGNTNVNNSHNNGNTNTGNTNTRISNTSNTNNTKISQTTNQNGNHDTAGSKTMAHTQAASHPKPPPPPKNNEKEGGKEPRR
jgi:hypothetical protein